MFTWFRMASVQQFKCLIRNPKCARYRSLLPSGCYCWDKLSRQILYWEVACSAEAACGIQAFYRLISLIGCFPYTMSNLLLIVASGFEVKITMEPMNKMSLKF